MAFRRSGARSWLVLGCLVACSPEVTPPATVPVQPAVEAGAVPKPVANAATPEVVAADTNAVDTKAVPAEPAQPGGSGDAARALAKQGDWAGASKAFAEAVAAAPGDARLVAELGWAEFNAGDLANARVHTNAALEKITEAPRRGAVLYNLGRILEAEGQPGPAGDAYRESLKLRPNKVVQARLKQLPAAAGAQEVADAPAELGACATWRPKAKLCGCFPEAGAGCKVQPFKLLADAGLFTLQVDDEFGGSQHYLIEGGDQGYAAVGMLGYEHAFHWLRGEKIILQDGRELLRVDVDQQEVEQDNSDDSVYRVITESANLCVRTPGSGKPAQCLLEVPLRVEMRHEKLRDPGQPAPPAKVRTVRFELKIDPEGFVDVKQLDGPASVIKDRQLERWVDGRKVPIAREE